MADRVKDELRRLEGLCLIAAERHYAAETPWYHLNYWLGIPSMMISAITGASAFSKFENHEWVTAGIALIAAGLAALLTFLDPFKRASVHHTTGRGFEALYHAAGRLVRLETPAETARVDALEKKLAELTLKFDELLQSSPALPGRAYAIAEKKLISGNGEVLRLVDASTPTQ